MNPPQSNPPSMKAILLQPSPQNIPWSYDSPLSTSDLYLSTNHPHPLPLPSPSTSPQYLTVKIHAVSISPLELSWPIHPLISPTSHIPCHDIAGVIIPPLSGPGSPVPGFEIGQKVFGMIPWDQQGGLSEYALISSQYLVKIPDDVELGFVEAASLVRNALTVWQASKLKLTLTDGRVFEKGKKVLITGATGAVGRAGAQIIRSLVGSGDGEGGGRIIAVGGKGSDGLRELGADVVVNYRENPNWDDYLKEIGEGGVDVIFDCVGGKVLEKSLKLVKDGGKIVTIGSPPPDYSGSEVRGWKELKERDVEGIFFIVKEDKGDLEEVVGLVGKGVVKGSVSEVVEGLTEDGVRGGWERALRGGIGGSVVVRVCGDDS